MRIVTLDLDAGDLCDIEPMLRQLTDSDEPLAAAKGRMLLELVRFLRASGPDPRVVGQLLFDELHLWPVDQVAQVTVTIRPDWYDYGARNDSLPRMHYRVNVRRAGETLSQDLRTVDMDRVERALHDAFGWDQ